MSRGSAPGGVMDLEKRYQLALRDRVDRHLRHGWVITCRDPITVQRGGESRVLRHPFAEDAARRG